MAVAYSVSYSWMIVCGRLAMAEAEDLGRAPSLRSSWPGRADKSLLMLTAGTIRTRYLTSIQANPAVICIFR